MTLMVWKVIPMTQMKVFRGQVNVDNNHFYNYLFDCVDETSTGHGNCFMTILVFELGEGRSDFCNLEDSYAICISSDT